jgi:hypothetical protein
LSLIETAVNDVVAGMVPRKYCSSSFNPGNLSPCWLTHSLFDSPSLDPWYCKSPAWIEARDKSDLKRDKPGMVLILGKGTFHRVDI